jgi:hypothetical protein
MKLRALHNGLIVRPLQDTNSKGYLEEETAWGFSVQAGLDGQKAGHGAFDRSLKRAAWAEVLVIGNECEEVVVGDFICIEPQMWTNTFDLNGIMARKTDETKVLAITKEEPNLYI